MYLRNSSTCAPLHRESDSGGRWLRRYCPKVFQSRRFCDSYRLSDGDELDGDGPPPPAEDPRAPAPEDDEPAPDAPRPPEKMTAAAGPRKKLSWLALSAADGSWPEIM
uniref:Uncharacterized protein n=1 Tax=Arundo donax TaxID=35708 RepID=A0A0A9CM57_ARUDO